MAIFWYTLRGGWRTTLDEEEREAALLEDLLAATAGTALLLLLGTETASLALFFRGIRCESDILGAEEEDDDDNGVARELALLRLPLPAEPARETSFWPPPMVVYREVGELSSRLGAFSGAD